ncbi:MAG: hypothetical protein Q8L78_04375 [Coxiellaceae bacterium]|nr:hypothetical protein [Coxiellaceae bacterium]
MVVKKETPLASVNVKGISNEISHAHFTKSLRDWLIKNSVAAVDLKNYLVAAGSDGTLPRKQCAWLIQILNLSGV